MDLVAHIRDFFTAAHSWLRVKKDILNNLNIFPVPDGDTGTNMLNTIASVAECMQNEYDSLQELSGALIDSALWGARGNSGVILANFLKGFFNTIGQAGTETPSFTDLAALLDWPTCLTS